MVSNPHSCLYNTFIEKGVSSGLTVKSIRESNQIFKNYADFAEYLFDGQKISTM